MRASINPPWPRPNTLRPSMHPAHWVLRLGWPARASPKVSGPITLAPAPAALSVGTDTGGAYVKTQRVLFRNAPWPFVAHLPALRVSAELRRVQFLDKDSETGAAPSPLDLRRRRFAGAGRAVRCSRMVWSSSLLRRRPFILGQSRRPAHPSRDVRRSVFRVRFLGRQKALAADESFSGIEYIALLNARYTLHITRRSCRSAASLAAVAVALALSMNRRVRRHCGLGVSAAGSIYRSLESPHRLKALINDHGVGVGERERLLDARMQEAYSAPCRCHHGPADLQGCSKLVSHVARLSCHGLAMRSRGLLRFPELRTARFIDPARPGPSDVPGLYLIPRFRAACAYFVQRIPLGLDFVRICAHDPARGNLAVLGYRVLVVSPTPAPNLVYCVDSRKARACELLHLSTHRSPEWYRGSSADIVLEIWA
ncbi:hypothetical protein EVG20_g4678 [Dentipellis fragilis]|uniref:Uncharacterized protein n=1 Tax=Dentipellis fragilis TaxID=205917 RepID=A0A4Y9YXW6_9AGAM|nr:hypothetical protein EVG20_g4678 [Dentipellis fragilis]